MADSPASHSSIDALTTATPNLAHLMAEQCTYTSGRLTLQALKHRCLEYCYAKLGRCPPSQSNIDALNTTTSNLADLYRYRTIDIYLWQITPLQSSIYALNTTTPNLANVYI